MTNPDDLPAHFTPRMFAAMHLRVPQSGEPWLDAMIRDSLRDEDARAALPAIIRVAHQTAMEAQKANGEFEKVLLQSSSWAELANQVAAAIAALNSK